MSSSSSSFLQVHHINFDHHEGMSVILAICPLKRP